MGAQGRYVRVQLSGTNNLSLAEVQVFGTGGGPVPSPTNLAQGKAAVQSSTLAGTPSAAAGSAVDGNTDGNFYDNSVTPYQSGTEPLVAGGSGNVRPQSVRLWSGIGRIVAATG